MSLGRILIAVLILLAVGAGATGWLIMTQRQSQNRIDVAYPEGIAAVVPLGLSAGRSPTLSASTANPLANDPNSVQEGKKLFTSMNCAGCHGYKAKGGMGPDLTDTAWRYGGTPIDVYKSIYEGRPQGMPAWGNALPPQSLWQLVAYLQSLGGTFSASSGDGKQQAAADQGQGAPAGQKQ
ncbi:c-type cytochrome [Mesorhizobium sp. INR15]|uniref:c-type cytochrome n=1 Tax=Mesorhizobium sp. INR15 TaxID=2654248 RepID=UPI0018967B80|nr:c-type cytochrome [Mesorhizobium sp. INR15]QPC95998.1 c-type cytochrome [Mesorhizobium sp. INR15]